MLVARNACVRVWAFGEFRVEYQAHNGSWKRVEPQEWGGNAHSRHVLRYLLLYGRRAGRGTLMNALWPGSDSLYLDEYLSKAMSNLRKVFRAENSDDLVRTKNERTLYELADQSLIWTDMDACETAMQEAEGLGYTSAEGCRLLETALAYFARGRLFEGEDGLWCHAKRDMLETAHYRCLLWLADAYETQGNLRQAEAQVEKLLLKNPLDETALTRLLILLHKQGMTAEAIRRYKSATTLFAKQGIPLSSSLELLIRQVADASQPAEGRALNIGISLMNEVPICPSTSPPGPAVLPDCFQPATLHTTLSDVQAPFLSPPPSTQTQLIVSSSAPASLSTNDLLLTEVVSGDCATWFSERLTHIIVFVTQQQRRVCATDFEKLLDRELRMFDEIKTMFDPDTYFLSRRSALLVIAALPKGLLGLLRHQKTIFIEEEFLPSCAASITACWYLLNGREFASVERALARYMPFLVSWAQQASPYQRTAAYLAAQACLLLGFIELHRLQFQQRIVYCREAVRHGREAEDHPLLVKALTQLGNAYYDQGIYAKMLQVYQEAYRLCTEDVPRSLQSKVLMGLAHAYAQHGQATEALNAIRKARETFPGEIEDVPAFLSADDGEYSLILFEGWIRLDLGKHYPDRDYNAQAAKALAQIDDVSTSMLVPERYRHEIINRRAQVAITLGELEAFHTYALQSAQILRVMHSEKRRQELVINYKNALRKWPHESTVVELADV
ncbi:MAG TPA: BTAD domain-containing putative transcriptional regulator, partial [Ktedonobacteraceae bacterium]|nr:BTAD domain-containing putative transcriptional regulator [Ktedonobacteraceae bacterium]